MLAHGTHESYGDELFANLRERTTSLPLTAREPEIDLADAYHISRRILSRREAEGERLVGKKIGVTSPAVQDMLGVHQPDFGYLTDAMQFAPGEPLPASSRLIQPRAEGELAFGLARDLVGPGVDEAAVLAATAWVAPCFEIVDSRIRDWKIAIQDTVADNASSGVFVVGDGVSPAGLTLPELRMRVRKNGAPLSEGRGAAALGNPLTCVAWLANTLGAFGIPLKAGEVVLSGSWVPLEPVSAGDCMEMTIDGVGSLAVVFA